MKRTPTKLCYVAAALIVTSSTCFAGPYQDRVIAMDPTYYYQLNESDTSTGAVDTMGRGPNGTYNGDYDGGLPEVGIPGPDFLIEGGAWTITDEWDDFGDMLDIVGLGDGNLAHASNNAGHITLGDGAEFAAGAMSVAMFARGGPAQGGDRLFTNNVEDPLTSFQIVVGNDGLVVSTNPEVECFDEEECGHRSLFFPEEGEPFTGTGADKGLNDEANGWWHIVAATHGSSELERTENIRLWLNGVDRTDDMLPGTVGWGTDTGLAKIGGRRDDAADTTTHSGAQDEVAIWLDRTLTDAEALSLYEAAITDAILGDFDGNGVVNVGDLDVMVLGDPAFDVTGDGVANKEDLDAMVNDIIVTWYGDSNGDGEFGSADLVAVFTAGKYDTGEAAVWTVGDWNLDTEFSSGDLVVAFTAGGYELGPKPAVAAVPEPGTGALALLTLPAIGFLRRRSRAVRA